MDEKHISWKAAFMPEIRFRDIAKYLVCFIVCISLSLQAVPCMAAEKTAISFRELNREEVFLKQSQAHVCTLTSSAMMIRRAAMLSGNEDWQQITEQSIRKYAWTEGIGLKWNFKAFGITVAHKSLSSKSELIKLLDKHPEGIVIYNSRKPHAILVTDYTDGVLYCSDPSNHKPIGRYPIAEASITAESAGRCWYVKSPVNLQVVKEDIQNQELQDEELQNETDQAEQDTVYQIDDCTDNVPVNMNAVYELDHLAYRILNSADKTVVCVGQLKEGTAAVVPDTVQINKEEYKVVKIAKSAFANSAKLKEVTIGTNVATIEPKAFYQCKKLKKVTIYASNLKAIGQDAFAKINKNAQVLLMADQTETSAALLTGTTFPKTATVGFSQDTEDGK